MLQSAGILPPVPKLRKRLLICEIACQKAERWPGPWRVAGASVHVVSHHRGHIGKGCKAEVNAKCRVRGKQRALSEEEVPENGTSAVVAAVSGTPDHCIVVVFRGQPGLTLTLY